MMENYEAWYGLELFSNTSHCFQYTSQMYITIIPNDKLIKFKLDKQAENGLTN